MKRADLHVHSRHSAHPSEWFLQRLGTQESYTDPEELYRAAKAAGMDFVTITDHNQIAGSLELTRRHPQDTFTGVEATAYFPEDGCKVHVLVYGLSQEQFERIEQVRTDIYALRDYLREQGLVHSVAHATFSVNRKLTLWHVERLILLFNCFEGINGARTQRANEAFSGILRGLTPMHLQDLMLRHNVETWDDSAWRKGQTAGSDDHGGLFIGRTYTEVSDAASPRDFLARLGRRESRIGGRHNDYRSFAFSIYKIAYEFSKQRSGGLPASILSTVNRMLFEDRQPGFRARLTLKGLSPFGRKPANDLRTMIREVVDDLSRVRGLPPEEKINRVYDRLCAISDTMMRSATDGLSRSVSQGDFAGLLRNASSLIPLVFMGIPFFTTINVLHESRPLSEELEARFGRPAPRRRTRILWFTDTIADLNGPSETICRLGWLAREEGYDLVPVACTPAREPRTSLPPQTILLPAITSYTPSFFNTFTLQIPSLLRTIRQVCDANPDEVLISTPGPVGLLGILCARLLHIPCRSVYHTDFGAQAELVIGDETAGKAIEEYVRWFYSMCDTLYVPTRHYMRILEERGYEASRMRLFRRGIEHAHFAPRADAREHAARLFGIPSEGTLLLYSGRVSREKSIDVLAATYRALRARHPDLVLAVCGDGPGFEEFRASMKDCRNVHLLGRLNRSELPLLYAAADIFVFPSTTDTFGMVVLEAQACGLPTVVSDVGGPQEIIRPGETGVVVPAGRVDAWVGAIEELIAMMKLYPERFVEMRNRAREHVLATYDWSRALDNLFESGRPEDELRTVQTVDEHVTA